MIVQPRVRGFICITAHPTGCANNIKEQIKYVEDHDKINGAKNVLVIGCSTGYGLASRIVAAFGSGANTLGVAFEKPPTDKKTASPGWYNTAAFEQEAAKKGLYARTINGDAFSNDIKAQTIDAIKNEMPGNIDLVVYSLASPRRIDPNTGEIYNSCLKPIGQTFSNKTVDVHKGEVTNVSIEPANEDDIAQTVKVMGGEDWQLWMDALLDADVLAKGCKTVAYTYIGPEITFPVYHHGTIGRAKQHLEQTAQALDQQLQQAIGGNAYISVNKALVTQASAAIPVVPLYISLLYKVMKDKGNHEGCIEQIYRLFADRLYSDNMPVDDKNRIRIDDWEMQDDVQQAVIEKWLQVTTENLENISDIKGYRDDFYKLFGFNRDDVDYNQEVDIELQIPSIRED